MEQLIKTLADGLDRRSFFRKLGKLGMGAAAVAGVLLIPRRAYACTTACPDNSPPAKGKNPCWGKEALNNGGTTITSSCSTGRSAGSKHCVQDLDTCACDCVAP